MSAQLALGAADRSGRWSGGRWTLSILLVTAVGAVVSATLAVAAARVAMQPPGAELRELIAVICGVAFTAVFLGVASGVLARRSLAMRLAVHAIVGPLFLASAVAVGVWVMFESTHDRDLVLILIGLSSVLAVILALGPAIGLRRDLAELYGAVEAIGEGERDVAGSMRRTDDLGRVGQAVGELAAYLDQAERSRSFMLAALGHDLRTPLAASRVTVEAVLDGVSPDPQRYLRSVLSDLDAVQAMVDNIFLLGRLESGQVELDLEDVDLVSVLDAVVTSLRPLAERSAVTLEADSSPTGLVRATSSELTRVITNLVENAIRHSPRDGTVRLMLDGPATLVVTDQGPGFPAEFCEDAFGAFTRADAARGRTTGGAGLGLAIAAAFVEQFGGRIRAEPGPGGTVMLELEPAD